MSHSVEDAEDPESLSGDVNRCRQRSGGECGGCGGSNPTSRGRAHAHTHARARGHMGGRNILRILRILRISGRRQARATGLMALAKHSSWSSRWRSRIQNTVTVQRGLTGGIGWGLTSWVRPARLGRRVVATAIGRAHV